MARTRVWADLIFSNIIADGANMPALDVLFDLAPNPIDTITVARLVGYLTITPDLPASLNATQRVDIGIGVVAEKSMSGVLTPQPDISTDYPARGWMYAATKWVSQSTTVGFVYPQWEFDIRTMRKVDKGILFIGAGSNNVDGTAFSVRLGGRIRALCLT